MKDSKLFCCFSVPLMKFLSAQKIRYEIVALNEKTKKKMWIYIKDERLNLALGKWSKS